MKIRTRVTVVSVGVMLAVAMALVGVAYWSQRAAEERFVTATLAGKRVLWEQIVARHLEQMKGFSKALTRDRVTLKALRAKDLAILREQVETTHNLFSSDGTLERLQIVDTDGVYLASAPNALSGRTSKTVALKAAAEEKIVYGVNRDDDGQLQAVLAFPLYARGKLKGVGVYSKGLQGILDDYQRNDHSDVVIIDPDGQSELQASDNQNQVQWPGRKGESGFEVVHADGRYFAVAAAPINDESGQTLGMLVSSQDQTETYSVQAVSLYTSIAIILLAIILSALGLYGYFRRAFRPIDEVVTTLSQVAEGNLNCKMPQRLANDETGLLIGSLCDMVEQLRNLVQDISGATDQLVQGSAELSTVTQESRQRILRQKEETDQVATAVNEMAATVQEVSANAANAAAAATQANQQADDGLEVVQATIASIDKLATDIRQAGEVIARLKHESENIGSVLDVIRGIAEQTNLLALNAAIEAARAGEQGRGFAVVADEVRTLASRTQQSTQEIQRMIENLQEGAAEAVQVMALSDGSSAKTIEKAQSADIALDSIHRSVTQISELNTQIARAADEQATVAEMINASAVRISEHAEGSAQATEQTANASAEISSIGDRLDGLVRRFTL